MYKNKLAKGFVFLGGIISIALAFTIIYEILIRSSDFISRINIAPHSQLAQVSASPDITSGLVGYWNMDSSDIDWNTNTIVDRSGTGNTGTLIGFNQATSSTSGKYNQALQFLNTNTKISVASSETLNMSVTNAFTYSVWMKVTAFTPSAGSFNCLICHDVNQQFSMHSSGGLIAFRPGGTVSQLLNYGAPVRTVDQWYHLVATYDGTTSKLYINAVMAGNTSSMESIGTAGRNPTLTIGGSFLGGIGLNGVIDEVRVYNRALSAQEVSALNQAANFDVVVITPPATPQGLTSSSPTFNSVSLSWSANQEANLKEYRLFQNNVQSAIIPAGQTTYEVTGLAPATTYTFKLSALNTANVESQKSSEISITTNTPSAPPTYPSKLQIKGTLSPDATGTYELQSSSYNNLPVWKRSDGVYYIYYINSSMARLTTTLGNESAGYWSWNYVLNNLSKGGVENIPSTASKTYTGTATISVGEEIGFPTPAQYMASRTAPSFKSGHTLPPLTRWGWSLSYDTNVELANRWGYALEFGDVDTNSVNALNNPNSTQSKMISLVQSNPSQYKLSVMIPRNSGIEIPSTAYTVDANGNPTKVWSPEAPDSVLSAMATSISNNLQKVTSKAPVSVVLNGGERYLGVCGWDCNAWKVDPKVVTAKGDLSWGDYASQRKAHQEMFFTNAVRALTNAIYIYYPTGNQFNDRTFGWDWDYKYMNKVADYPGISMYWGEFNTGWKGQGNYGMLSQVLYAHGYDVKFGKPHSYNWVNAGWGVTKPDGWADIPRYYGFLKTYYTSGMLGGIAGYFAYPTGGFNLPFDSNTPPHWLQQIETLGRVHGEFSYLEDILRNGDLLPGPDKHISAADQPAYEFRTGFADTRVLARKMRNSKRWLISAWAADNLTRTVNVDIPGLSNISVRATPAGSLYDARIVNGVQTLTELDGGSMSPGVITLPSSQPDSDSSAPYVPAPVITTYTLSLTKSGTGTGTVTGGSISCGATCSQVSNSGTTVTLTATPSSGSTFVGWGGGCSGTGSCVVTLNSNASITATFNKTLTDPIPPAPVINNLPVLSSIGSKSVDENSTLTFTILATDIDGDTLTYFASSTLPAGATFNNSTRVFTWKPTFTQSGVYTQTFLVSDGNGGVDSETINITVNNINRAPSANAGNDQTITLPANANLSASASSDPDADNLSYSWTKVSGPSSTIASPSSVSTVISFASNGVYVFRLTVSDGKFSSVDDISIKVDSTPPIGIADRDNDGVPDIGDKCPNTKPGRTVNTVGCPLPKTSKFTLKTDLSSVDINSISSFEIGNAHGKITWNQSSSPFSLIRSDDQLDIDSNLDIASNTINLNSQSLPELNKNSTVTIYNVNVARPRIMKDGQVCTSCTIISHQNNTVTFTVPGFSIYTIIEELVPLQIIMPTDTQTSRSGSRRSSSSGSQTVTTVPPGVAPTIAQPASNVNPYLPKNSTNSKPVVKPTTAPTPAVVYTDLVLDGGPFEAYKTPTFWELFIQYLKDVWNTAFQLSRGSVLRIYNGFIEVF